MSPEDDVHFQRRALGALETLLALDPAKRRDEFERLCLTDPALRERLEALLTAVENQDQYPEAESTVSLNDTIECGQSYLPERIGKYRILSELDAGGQAVVYRAMHPGLEREVAVKLSRTSVTRSTDLGTQLVAEGRLLAELDQPGVARIYDLDFHGEFPYLVLELIRGRNLSRYAADEDLTERRAARLVATLARNLAVAHRRGIVHRDMKPKNIVIDEAGVPWILDFGLALLRTPWRETSEDEPSISGTIPYMAPEQARGEVERIGPRSDIFSLGAVLHFLLLGRGPFYVDERVTSWQEALERVGRCEFDREELTRHGVSAGLRAICLKALEAQPEHRHQSADELAAALEAYLGRPRRRRILVGMLGLLCVAAFSFFAWPRTGSGPLAFEKLNVVHYRLAKNGQEVVPVGELGESSFRTTEGDYLRVDVSLSEAAYAYVLFFNPDGSCQLLSPADDDTPPRKQRVWKLPEESADAWQLTDGAGRQALVAVASREPLPAFSKWVADAGIKGWSPEGQDGGIFRFDGEHVTVLGPGARRKRADKQKLPRIRPLAELGELLRARSEFEAVEAVTFPVLPRGEEL